MENWHSIVKFILTSLKFSLDQLMKSKRKKEFTSFDMLITIYVLKSEEKHLFLEDKELCECGSKNGVK